MVTLRCARNVPHTMPKNRYFWTSLSSRIALGVAGAFLASVWALTWYASTSLRSDMQSELGAQQTATLGILAPILEHDFDERLHTLRAVAKEITPQWVARPADLSRLLAQRPLLEGHFNSGAVVVDTQGKVIATANGAVWQADENQGADPAIRAALDNGQANVGAPQRHAGTQVPYITFAVPIRAGEHQVQGVLAAHVLLDRASFLDEFIDPHYGKTGTFFLIDPQARTIVTATDRHRILQPLPPVGASAAVDQFVQGMEGSAVYTNAAGVEVLSSSKRLSNPLWDLGVSQPTSEAFAALQRQQTRIYVAAAIITILTMLLGLPLLLRELRPIREAAHALKHMGDGKQAHHPLPVPRQTEVAELIAGFNQLLQTLTERESLLRDLFNTSSVAILLVDTDMRVTQANPCMGEMFRCPTDQLLGVEYADLLDPSQREIGRTRTQALLNANLDTVDVDRLFLRRDGSTFWGRLTGRRMYGPDGGLRGLVGAVTDITERKQLQQFDNFRSRTLEALAQDESLDTILLQAVRGVEEIIAHSLCSCILLTEDGKALGRSFGPSLPAFYTEALIGLPIGPLVGSCGAAAFLGQRVVAESIATHPNWAPYKDLAAKAGLGSCWSQPIHGSDGRVLGTFAVYHATPHTPGDTDITIIEQSAKLAAIAIERSEVALRLRRSEEHYRLLTEGVSDVVWRQDQNNVFTYISPSDERLRGFPAHEVVGHHVFDLMTPESIDIIKEVARARPPLQDDDIHHNTLTFVLEQKCKDGSTVWTEVRSTAERDAQGRLTGFRGISRDITERRKIESRLQLAASVMTHAQEGILITSPQGIILEVNAAFSAITGYAREEVIGANPRLLKSGREDTAFYTDMFDQLQSTGRWQGEIWNRRKDGTLYAQSGTISAVRDERGNISHYVSLFTDVTALKEHQQRLEHSAHYDALTDLPNRVLMMDRLHQAMSQAHRRGTPLAVVFLDLDGFKTVNDQHGHAVGDALLQALANRMRATLRDGDTLARLGGDEFVAVLVDLPDSAASIPLLQRLIQAASLPVQIDNRQLQVSASLGVSFYPQASDIEADMLLRQADQAMYRAKLGGKNRYHLFATHPG